MKKPSKSYCSVCPSKLKLALKEEEALSEPKKINKTPRFKPKSEQDIIYQTFAKQPFIKANVDECLKKRNVAIDDRFQATIDFVDEFGRVPTASESYNGIRVGKWFSQRKYKMKSTDSPIYEKLSTHPIIKIELDQNLDKKLQNQDNIEYTWDEKFQMTCEFADQNKRAPIFSDKNDKINVGLWFITQMGKLNSTDDEIYLKLSVNQYLKARMDKYLIDKEKRKDLPVISATDREKMFYDYVAKHKKCPPVKNVAGKWFCNQKKFIDSSESKVYKKFAQNLIVKANLDEYLLDKANRASRDECLANFLKKTEDDKKIPSQDTTEGIWFSNQKRRSIRSENDEMYKLLAVNPLVKAHLDKCLKLRDKKLLNEFNEMNE